MSSKNSFPPLTGWEPTRKTLQLYSRILGVVPRTHAEFHPKWWHISLKVQPDGLAIDSIPLPGGSAFWLKMDLRQHDIILATSQGDEQRWRMTKGTSSTALGDQVLTAVAELGLTGEYAREKFADDEERVYDPGAAETFLTAVGLADRIFKKQRASLEGEVGPVQLWPHGFDLAFEWFGTRVETYEYEGEVQEYPSQINFGFYPSEPIYFYCNPWPFDTDKLVDKLLPGGASWHVEGWQGTILPYAAVAGDSNAEERLLSYFQEVYKLASPLLIV